MPGRADDAGPGPPDESLSTIGGNPLAGADYGPRPRILGLAADSRGNVYVADHGHHRLMRIRSDGKVKVVLHSGPFWGPTGVAVVGDELNVLEDRAENGFYVLGYLSGPRVRKISSDGRVTTLATVGAGGMRVFCTMLLAIPVAGVVAWRTKHGRKRSAGPVPPASETRLNVL